MLGLDRVGAVCTDREDRHCAFLGLDSVGADAMGRGERAASGNHSAATQKVSGLPAGHRRASGNSRMAAILSELTTLLWVKDVRYAISTSIQRHNLMTGWDSASRRQGAQGKPMHIARARSKCTMP